MFDHTHREFGYIFSVVVEKHSVFLIWLEAKFCLFEAKENQQQKMDAKKIIYLSIVKLNVENFHFHFRKKNEFQLYLMIVKIIQTKLYMKIDDDQWKCPLSHYL